jgi:hypothetical protein
LGKPVARAVAAGKMTPEEAEAVSAMFGDHGSHQDLKLV